MVRLLAIPVLVVFTSGLAAAPQSFAVGYTLKRGPLTIARMAREFTITPSGTYRFTSETTAAGLATLFLGARIRESSEGTVDRGVLAPRRYEYHRSGARERRVTVEFDHRAGTVAGFAEGQDWRLQLLPGMLDKLLYQVVLMHDLQAARRNLRYLVVDAGRAKTYELSIVGENTIETPLGAYRTLRLQRQQAGSERSTTLWCAPDLGFLPVRVDYREKDGSTTTAILSSMTVAPAPSSGGTGANGYR